MPMYEKKTVWLQVDSWSAHSFVPHVHHQLELMICTEGRLEVSCNATVKTLFPGDLMLAFSNDVHAYRKGEQGKGIMIIVSGDYLPTLDGCLEGKQYENFLPASDFSFVPLCEALLKEYHSDACRQTMMGYLYLIFANALKRLPVRPGVRQIHKETFSLVLEYLSLHYTEKLSLKDLAKRFGVDSCHLSRLFRQKLSCGYLHYLHELRVEYAKRLLRTSDESISRILLQSGFSDQKSFNRVFKELTGMTPGAYRKK